jgi:hypothetical protein
VLIIRRSLARQSFEDYVSGKLSLSFFLPHRNQKSHISFPTIFSKLSFVKRGKTLGFADGRDKGAKIASPHLLLCYAF